MGFTYLIKQSRYLLLFYTIVQEKKKKPNKTKHQLPKGNLDMPLIRNRPVITKNAPSEMTICIFKSMGCG